MSEQTTAVLVLILLLQIKHLIADFFLQTPAMLKDRQVYWHMGRAAHAGVHAVGSIIVFLLVGTPMSVLVTLVVLEFIVHFHIDWGKAKFTEDRKLTPTDAAYWYANGVDQALHHFTYLAMTWAWAIYVG